MTETRTGRQVLGTVKWFDPAKGFGFVVANEGGPDILLHANVLRNFGQGSVADGAEIEVVVQETGTSLKMRQKKTQSASVFSVGSRLEVKLGSRRR